MWTEWNCVGTYEETLPLLYYKRVNAVHFWDLLEQGNFVEILLHPMTQHLLNQQN
jgi:hypothetical protein